MADGTGVLRIFDVSIPNLLDEIGVFSEAADVREIDVALNLAYLADHPDEIVVVDVSNPAAPTRLGGAVLPYGRPNAIDVQGSYLYLADGLRSARLYDVSDPSAPFDAVGYDPKAPNLYGVVVNGNLACFSGRDGLRVIDFGPEYVPEPSQTLLYACALATLAVLRRRRA